MQKNASNLSHDAFLLCMIDYVFFISMRVYLLCLLHRAKLLQKNTFLIDERYMTGKAIRCEEPYLENDSRHDTRYCTVHSRLYGGKCLTSYG